MEIPNNNFKIGEDIRLKGTIYHHGVVISMHYLITRLGNTWVYRVALHPSGFGEWVEIDCESVLLDK